MVSLSAEHRKNAKVSGGEEAEVTIELDTEPRIVELPAGLEKALNNNSGAKKYYETLSNSKKNI